MKKAENDTTSPTPLDLIDLSYFCVESAIITDFY